MIAGISVIAVLIMIAAALFIRQKMKRKRELASTTRINPEMS